MLDSLCRRLEKKIPLGSRASNHAASTAARPPASSYTAVASRTSPATARPISAMRRANSGESSAQTWTASTNSWNSPTKAEVQSPEPRGESAIRAASPAKKTSSPPLSSDPIEVSETPAAAATRSPTARPVGTPMASPGRLRPRRRTSQ